jgi:hypothetical protein
MPAWAFPAVLLGRCGEKSRTLTLSGSDTAGQGRIWNVERNGRRYWSYEGVNFEIPSSDKHKGSFEVTLDSFACSEHYDSQKRLISTIHPGEWCSVSPYSLPVRRGQRFCASVRPVVFYPRPHSLAHQMVPR